MKKRLLAMLLAVVTTITSLPTPVYAAADDAVVDYVDEETDADALEVVVPDEADAVEVTEAPAEEAVTEENTDAAVAADVEQPAVEEAAPVEVNVTEETGEADRNLPDVTEQDAVTFANATHGYYGVKAPSLYGNTNFRFTEGEWDYDGGIDNDNVITVARNAQKSLYDFDDWDEVLDANGKVAYDYKFSLAEGWDKENLDKMSYTEIKPGSIVTVGGLQVSANETWLHRADDPAKVYLTKDSEYYVDADEVVWVKDSFGVGRKLDRYTNNSIVKSEIKDGVTYRTIAYAWSGFSLADGIWRDHEDNYTAYNSELDDNNTVFPNNVYRDVKLNEEGKEEPISEYYTLDRTHNSKSDEIAWSYPGGTEKRVYTEGVDYVTKEGVVNFIDEKGEEIPFTAWYNLGNDDFDTVDGVQYCNVEYGVNGYFDGTNKTIGVYRAARYDTDTAAWVEYGPYFSKNRLKRTGVSTNALSIVSVNKAGVYTLKAEVSYSVSRNALGNSTDREIVKVTEVGYATIFVNIKDDVNSGWAKISYELGGKKDVLNRADYSKLGGLEAKAAYKVDWAVRSGEPANEKFTADDKGEYKSNKYWAPNSSWGLTLVKTSDAEANGNCDSDGKDLYLDGDGAAFFETPVIVDKTAPGLYGDKERNNYNAAEKESIKISGIYGDNKFLYMKGNDDRDYPAAGDMNKTDAYGDNYTNGIAFRADAAKGTLDIYPQKAGISTLDAYVQYATSGTRDGVKESGSATTGSHTPIYMIIKEADPQGKIDGIVRGLASYDEEGKEVKDEANKTVYVDYLKINGLEEGTYRLRSASDNHIYKGALVGIKPNNSWGATATGEIRAISTGNTVAVKDIYGEWQDANTIHYVLINTFAIKEDSVILEKVNDDNEALNATQTIAISAEEIFVDIVPPMAGHKQVTTDDVVNGVKPSMTDLNYDVHWRFDAGHKGQGRDFFYSVSEVKWNEAPQADGTFEKDKVYSATVTLAISSNEALSSNVVFKKDLTADNIHINNNIFINTDSGNKDLTVAAANISEIKVDGRTLTFKVTFEKAFIQYEVHRIEVYDRLNGRWVTDLAEPAVYVAPGKKVTLEVYAVNKFGNRPSMPSISYNGSLNGGKVLWEDLYISRQNGDGVLLDEENGFRYEFETDDHGETYTVKKYNDETDVWIETIADLTYDEFMAEYVSKYKMTAWNPDVSDDDLYAVFTISANAAASGEDKITFTAEDGLIPSKEIAIRYYVAAEAPKDLTVEYGVVLKFGEGANAVERTFDVIHGLTPHTWYIIKTRRGTYSLYSDDKGDIYVEIINGVSQIAGWYMNNNDYRPISIQVAYSESSKKAMSDPYYLYVKRAYTEKDIYTRLTAAEVGRAVNGTVNLYTGYNTNSSRFTVSNNIVWKDKDGSVVAPGTPFGEKDSIYTVSFSVRMQKVKIDENGGQVWSYDEGELPYNNVKLSNEHFFVPGAVSSNIVAKEGTDNVFDVSATFKTVEAGKVPVALAYIKSTNNSIELGENYNRSTNDDYAVSEGWGEAEGEVYVTFFYPVNATAPIGVTYTDSTTNVDVSVSMNDANGNKTRAQVSGNKAGDASIGAVIANADGSKTELKAEISDASNVYVKLAAPYNANNTDDTNYISGLTEGKIYHAQAYFAEDKYGNSYTGYNDGADGVDYYTGVAVAGLGQNKNVTGFKRLTSWTDYEDNDPTVARNTVRVQAVYVAEDGTIESRYNSAYVEIPLSNRIYKKGFYVTWPYGATDAPTTYTYTGQKIEPEVWVWYDGMRLDNTNFYKVVYKNNVNVTTKKKATIQVVGKNGLKGKSNVVEFEITPRNINNATTYSGDTIKKMVTVKKGTKLAKMKVNLYDFGQYTKTLKAKKDYKLNSNTAVFNADGWVLVEGQGNYTGTMLLKVVTVDKFAKLTINMANKGKVEYSYYRDGIERVLPAMNVTVGGKNGTKLTEGLDFKIYVEENKKANGDGVHNVGTYKLYVVGNGVYGGKLVKKSFKITPKKLTNVEVNVDEIAAWVAGYQYDNIMGATLERGLDEGGKSAPALKIVADNINLGYSYNSKKYVRTAVDKSYSYTLKDYVNVGAWNDNLGYTVEGYGYLKYMGKTAGYNNMDNAEVFKPVDSVYVTYSKNKKVGKASYTIKFGGNFKGTKAIKGTFTVAETNFNRGWQAYNGSDTNVASLRIPDVAYTGKAGTYFSNPMIYYNNATEGENGYTDAKQVLYKKGRDYTVKYYKDQWYKEELNSKNKLSLQPGQQYATVYVKIEGKGGYGATVDGKKGAIMTTYRVYDPKKVEGGCVDLKSMKYYNGDAKPVKVKVQYTPSAYIITSGSGKKLATITNDMLQDGYNLQYVIRSSSKNPNWQVSMYGIDRIGVEGKVVGFKNMKVTVKGDLEKEWYR